jgi:PAS domain S-box-containing protein
MNSILNKPLRIKIVIIAASLLLGLSIWIIDALIDSLIFYQGSLWDLLILNAPNQEIYMRLVILACFLGFGFFVSRIVASRSRTIVALSKSEAKLAATLKSTGDGIIAADTEGRVVFMNPVAQNITGWNESEAKGRPLNDVFYIIDEITGEKSENPVEKVIREKKLVRLADHTILIRKDGSRITINDGASPIIDDSGNLHGVVIIFRDDSEKRKTEAALKSSEETARALLNSPPDTSMLLDIDGNILALNDAAAKTLRNHPDQLIGTCVYNYFPAGLAESRKSHVYSVIKTGKPSRFEDERSGIVYDNTVYPVSNAEGSIDKIAVFAADITERKKAEEALKDSEEKFRTIIKNTQAIIFIIDQDGKFTLSEGKGLSVLGLKPGQVVGQSAFEMYKDFPEIINGINQALRGNAYNVTVDVNGIIFDTSYSPYKDSKGNIIGTIGMAIDITERKLAESHLKNSEEKFRTLFEAANDSIFIVEVSGNGAKFVDCNSRTLEIFGCDSRDEVLGKCPADFSPEFQADRRLSIERIREIAAAAMNGELQHFDWIHCKLDRTPFDAEVTVNRIDIAGKPFLQVMARDVTERKKAEEAIKESEEKFRNLAERSPNMIFINSRGKVVFVNDKCEEIMGYTKEEFYAPDFDFLKLIAPEYISLIRENLGRHMKGEEIQPYEYEIVSKKGERLNSIISTKLIKYEGKESILGIVTDISGLKKAEKALKKSENDLVKAQRIAGVGSWEWGIARKEMSWSEEMYRIYGIEKNTELTLELIRGLIYPEDLVLFESAVKDFFNEVPPKSFEFRIIRPGGDIAYVQSTAEAQYNGKGEPVSLIGTVQNITERKKAEELREKLIADLQKAANEIKTLTGFIPICASCKKIRDDKGYWEQIETYIMERSDAEFSHGLCPECSEKLYPDL